jgi:ferredoxin
MRVKVDGTKCTGIGLCEMTAPAVFEVGEDGQSHAINERPSEAQRPTVEEAVANCPTQALSIED